ncbi:MAG TPA: AAA family ATPase [Candidatus Cybelea sp.]|nr:AAA family ATPase [Candidatus Cybelea sp.]
MGFAGPIGAGKTTGALYLSEKYHLGYVRYSQVIAEWTEEDEDAKDRLQARGWDIVSKGLQADLNRRVLAKMGSHQSYAVDGLRNDTDQHSLRDAFGRAFFLIYVEAPSAIRRSRTFSSGRFSTCQAFEAADSHPVERAISGLRQHSFSVVKNIGTLRNYKWALDAIIRRIERASSGEQL